MSHDHNSLRKQCTWSKEPHLCQTPALTVAATRMQLTDLQLQGLLLPQASATVLSLPLRW